MIRKSLVLMRLAVLIALSAGDSQAQSTSSQVAIPPSNAGSETGLTDSPARESSLFNSSGWRTIFRMPDLPAPSLPGFSTLRATTSNTFHQAKRSTRRWWIRTKNFLSPFDTQADDSPDGGLGRDRSTSQNSEGGWSWWFSEPEEREIETVNDFLRQERPKL